MRSRVLYVVCVYVALQSVLADGPDKKREILEMLDGSSDDQEVRIVEGIAKLEDTTSSLSDPYQTPGPIYGPESLFFLDGLCFQSAFEKYEYSVCPFQNVTQRRLTNARSVLLGVWGTWQEDTNPPYSIMQYHHGLTCGNHDRDLKLILECGHDNFAVLHSDEPTTCSYVVKFGIPVPCTVVQQSSIVPRPEEPVQSANDLTTTAPESTSSAASPASSAASSSNAAPSSSSENCNEAFQTLGSCVAAPRTLPPTAKEAVTNGARSYANEELSREALLHLAAQFESLKQELQGLAEAVQGMRVGQ